MESAGEPTLAGIVRLTGAVNRWVLADRRGQAPAHRLRRGGRTFLSLVDVVVVLAEIDADPHSAAALLARIDRTLAEPIARPPRRPPAEGPTPPGRAAGPAPPRSAAAHPA